MKRMQLKKILTAYFGPLKTGCVDVLKKCQNASVKPNPKLLEIPASGRITEKVLKNFVETIGDAR